MEPLIEMLQALIDDANAYLEDCKSEGDRETIRAADDYVTELNGILLRIEQISPPFDYEVDEEIADDDDQSPDYQD